MPLFGGQDGENACPDSQEKVFLDKTYGARKGNGFIYKAEENDKKGAEKKWCF